MAAMAAMYASLQVRHAASASSSAKLALALFEQATTLRRRMLKVLDYNLGDRADIGATHSYRARRRQSDEAQPRDLSPHPALPCPGSAAATPGKDRQPDSLGTICTSASTP
jgi:hypothetical protein